MLTDIKKLVASAVGGEAVVERSSAAARELLSSVLAAGFGRPLAVMALMTASGAALESTMPYAFQHVIDTLASPLEVEHSVYFWFCLLLGLGLASMVAFRLQQAIDMHVGPRMAAHLQEFQLDKLIRLSPVYLGAKNNGAIVQAVKGSAMAFLGLVQLATFDFVNICVVSLAVAMVLLSADPLYAAIVVGWIIIYATGVALFARGCFILGFRRFMASSASAGEIGDVILNFETVFNFGRFDHERNRLKGALDVEAFRSRKLRQYVLFMRIFAGSAVFVLLGVMSFLALREVMHGRQSVGLFVLAFSATNVLVTAVFDLSRQLVSVYENIGTLFGALATVADLAPLPERSLTAPPLIARNGAIDFRGIEFAFAEKPPLFDGLDLRIEAGEKVGLVGPSGAGKTTLLRLLLSQLPLNGGAIEIDGQNIADYSLVSLQNSIATVSQIPSLLNRSFAENIAYAAPHTPQEEIVRVSQLARLHEVITTRLGGYGSVTGQSGMTISGGERQRVSIARAMLKDSAAILLLDEATSALDSETESQIQEMLSSVFAGRTVLAIAHRLSTIRQMDRIVYLDQGRIVEQGTHEELLLRGGRYAHVWGLQEGNSNLRVFA